QGDAEHLVELAERLADVRHRDRHVVDALDLHRALSSRRRTSSVLVISTTFSGTRPSVLPSSGAKRGSPRSRKGRAGVFLSPTMRSVTLPVRGPSGSLATTWLAA